MVSYTHQINGLLDTIVEKNKRLDRVREIVAAAVAVEYIPLPLAMSIRAACDDELPDDSQELELALEFPTVVE